MTSTAKYKTSAPNKPKSCWDLFCSFTLMAMQAFGGSTAIAQQFLVDQKKWLTQSEFLDLLTVSQVLPGPNIMILTIVVGDRHFGWRGATCLFPRHDYASGNAHALRLCLLSTVRREQMGIRCSGRYGRICLRDGGRRRHEASLQLQRKYHHAAGLDFWLGHHIHHRRHAEDFHGLHSADCRYSSLLLGVVPIH